MLLGLINGFNLLPILPLDGGRLLNQFLFSRNRYLEGVLQFLAAFALIACGAALGGMFLFFLGVLLLMRRRADVQDEHHRPAHRPGMLDDQTAADGRADSAADIAGNGRGGASRLPA